MNSCKICQGNTVKIEIVKTLKIYHRCTTCDYISLDEKFHLKDVDEKKHYDNHHNNLQSLGYVKMFENLIDEYIAPYENNINTVLDFGCGEGAVLPALLEKRDLTCDRYDLFYFPKKIYETKKYSMIVSTEVFEHLSQPLEVMQKLVSHLKEDGYLLLMSSFHPCSDEEFIKWFYIQDSTHIGFFSIKTFEYIANMLELKIVKDNSKNIILLSNMSKFNFIIPQENQTTFYKV